MKLLGEKELEVAVLKDVLKKRINFRLFISNSIRVDLKRIFYQANSWYFGS